MKELFNQEPRVFRNTELIYNNDLAHFVSHMGYDAILSVMDQLQRQGVKRVGLMVKPRPN